MMAMDATIVFLQFIRPSPPYDHMGEIHARDKRGLGLETVNLGRHGDGMLQLHGDHGKAMLYGITRQWARDVCTAERDILMNYDQYDQQDK